jgi:hypothetical protein
MDASQAPVVGPLWSYAKRLYAGLLLANHAHPPSIIVSGTLIACNINVIRPYTGLLSAVFLRSDDVHVINSDYSTPTAQSISIDVKTPGKRVWAATGNTSLGTDTLSTFPIDGWLMSSIDLKLDSDISARRPALGPLFRLK